MGDPIIHVLCVLECLNLGNNFITPFFNFRPHVGMCLGDLGLDILA